MQHPQKTLIPDLHHLYKYFCCCSIFVSLSSTPLRLLPPASCMLPHGSFHGMVSRVFSSATALFIYFLVEKEKGKQVSFLPGFRNKTIQTVYYHKTCDIDGNSARVTRLDLISPLIFQALILLAHHFLILFLFLHKPSQQTHSVP